MEKISGNFRIKEQHCRNNGNSNHQGRAGEKNRSGFVENGIWKAMKRTSAQGNGSLTFLLLYLLLSIFSALVFSILYRRSVNQGKGGILWLVLTLLCAAFYGILAYSLVASSSPSVDATYFWLGVITLAANSLAVLLIISKRRR